MAELSKCQAAAPDRRLFHFYMRNDQARHLYHHLDSIDLTQVELLHQRARLGFWLCAGLGAVLVAAFALLRAHQSGQGFGLEWADLLLLGAIGFAAVGYVFGAQVTPALGAERVICWVCVMALPLTVPGTLLHWPEQPIHTTSWLALGYVGVFSMWVGFFAWFRGLALGGALRVSQVQLVQPFLSILAAVPLLGEPLEVMTLGFALAVVAVVFLGKRLSAAPAPLAPAKDAA